MTTSQIAEKIRENLNVGYTVYFNVEDSEGNDVKIRVSDHNCRTWNNRETKTLSFVTKRTGVEGGRGYTRKEWMILENGLTDTYQEIEEVIDWELN